MFGAIACDPVVDLHIVNDTPYPVDIVVFNVNVSSTSVSGQYIDSFLELQPGELSTFKSCTFCLVPPDHTVSKRFIGNERTEFLVAAVAAYQVAGAERHELLFRKIVTGEDVEIKIVDLR